MINMISKQARNDIKAALKASKYPSFIHFDGKTLFELKKGKQFKNDRSAVLLSTVLKQKQVDKLTL